MLWLNPLKNVVQPTQAVSSSLQDLSPALNLPRTGIQGLQAESRVTAALGAGVCAVVWGWRDRVEGGAPCSHRCPTGGQGADCWGQGSNCPRKKHRRLKGGFPKFHSKTVPEHGQKRESTTWIASSLEGITNSAPLLMVTLFLEAH